ncbi:hypothetical protein ARGLB_113_00600 [Arthrobacter globiformis NBRC 12137]|uniref:Uncharacterized protein n=1 Tax=Arthrobacter globiformis (strain ATCC 8010 / DSM 20124 / JCM 1332 / NBRC 12137 / NCIMB 8907 / NRRL B-2979 / 168) TaxID=1077972 RepID=H0QTQ3_ARTG1|nr:hypothetical protein ARGLB_113_00600 [Arthrobacter globiformis NBRC 12137]
MPTLYEAEFRQDGMCPKGQAPLAQIAKDFGLSDTTLSAGLPSPNVRNRDGRDLGGGVG